MNKKEVTGGCGDSHVDGVESGGRDQRSVNQHEVKERQRLLPPQSGCGLEEDRW